MKDWIETTQTAQKGNDRVLIRKKAISAIKSAGGETVIHIDGARFHCNMPFDELSKEILPQLGRPPKVTK